jgi:hypothetical protein
MRVVIALVVIVGLFSYLDSLTVRYQRSDGIWMNYYCYDLAFAENTVTTTDGQTFVVTDDGGFAVTYTMDAINNIVNQASIAFDRDTKQYQKDHETFLIWEGVLVNAQQALTNWQATQPAPPAQLKTKQIAK